MALSRSQRIAALYQALEERILVMDGAQGTYLQAKGLTPQDFGGEALDGCNEWLVRSKPEVIEGMYADYLEAGADIIETDTFGGTPLVMEEYGLGGQAEGLNQEAAQLARRMAEKYSTPEKPRFVCGSMGPTTKSLSLTGGISFQDLSHHFYIQARGLVAGGVDYLLLETSPDTRNIKAGLVAIRRLERELGEEVPVAVSLTIEPAGTMLAGQGVEAAYAGLMHEKLLYIGLNCSTGPAFMTDHVRSLAELAKTRVAVVPNAGLPDEDGRYLETPEMMAAVLARFVEHGWINVVGGCCGTRPDHIQAFAKLAQGTKPRKVVDHHRALLSGVELLELTEDNRPIIVGERTNAVGSRLFRQLIEQEKFEEASAIARRQVAGGAQIIDVNLANPDRDEKADMAAFMEFVIHKVKAPFMIDSTDAAVIAGALPYCQGKSVINSINLEDGEERFEQVVPLALSYGAALVVGTIDEDPEHGMAVTRQRKLEVARRSYGLLTEKYGVQPEDIIFDPLVFPCATGDENYLGSAVETIEGVRLIKQAFPQSKTILGVSNVSFGLPAAGREVLNAVFLYHATQAGLDMAIVNAEKLVRYTAISDEERTLAEDLLFGRGEDPVAAFAAHFREKKAAPLVAGPRPPLMERLSGYILAGSKDGLEADLEEALAAMSPLDIINGPLMAGMEEVGRQFNANKLIVAEVLQSAEAMKAAVNYLEPRMEAGESSHVGTLLLATVKGDVHDIGKNLVEIIFSNNGYKVVNLGIKVPPEKLIEAAKEHRPDLVGLSGLLVKSAHQMVTTAEDMHQAGVEVPILVGGAALSKGFTVNRIRPAYGGALVAYAKDAMAGLDLANRILNPATRQAVSDEMASTAQAAVEPGEAKASFPVRRSSRVKVELAPPPVPDTLRHVLPKLKLDEVWRYLNPQMLYIKHMGLKGSLRKLLAEGDPKAKQLEALFDELKAQGRAGGMKASAVYQFFPAVSHVEEGANAFSLLDGQGRPLHRFEFPRQEKEDGLSLPDFVLPGKEGQPDHVGLFVVTAGWSIREQAQALKEQGEYLKSHALQALALETAEAGAEWLHATMRAMWGFPDGPEMAMGEVFQSRYRGCRYSPGYPACPDLSAQEGIFKLLNPPDIGVELTEGHMMEPEASVSAFVFHHPDAAYFSVGGQE